MRICVSCGEAKPEDDFRLRKSASTGRHYRGRKCKACHQGVSALWRRNNKDRVKVYRATAYNKPGVKENNRVKAIQAHYVRTYGITIEDRGAILAGQGGKCLICETVEPRGKGWCIDHNHTSGRIRGILCHPCNVMIGMARESPLILYNAYKYVDAQKDICDANSE